MVAVLRLIRVMALGVLIELKLRNVGFMEEENTRPQRKTL